MQIFLQWIVLTLVTLETLVTMVKARQLTMDSDACPYRDVTCADGHENGGSVLFSVETAMVCPKHSLI